MVCALCITSSEVFANIRFFLDPNNNATVSNSNVTVYGASPGNEIVTIAPGMSGILIDQNIERINFSGASISYTFRQTGNMIIVYDSTGTTLIATAAVQDDADGTLLSFSDGTASAKFSGSIITLGTQTVSSGVATALTLF